MITKLYLMKSDESRIACSFKGSLWIFSDSYKKLQVLSYFIISLVESISVELS